ncbi:hypothetical protein ACSBR1_005328 [Camellia fascicularis]
MSWIGRERCDDDFSVIGDKGEIGFIDFEDTTNLCVLMTQMKRVRFLSPFHFPSYKESLCLFLLEKLPRIQLPCGTLGSQLFLFKSRRFVHFIPPETIQSIQTRTTFKAFLRDFLSRIEFFCHSRLKLFGYLANQKTLVCTHPWYILM